MKTTNRTEGISVIICSYNGEKKIKATLSAILEQKIPSFLSWEVIFIDNNSSDNTLSNVKNYSSLFESKKIPLSFYSEPKKGKFHALNRGISHANYQYFIVVDDDNWLYPNYVAKAFELIHNKPYIGAIGSCSEPVFEHTPEKLPKWFKNNQGCYAIGSQGKDGDVTERKHLWGAGMVSQTELYEKMYAEHPSLLFDNGIEDIYIAEDTEYCLRLILKGYQLYYSSDLKLKHYVPQERLSYDYWEKLNSNIRNSYKIIDYYNALWKLKNPKYKSKIRRLRLKLASKYRYLVTSDPTKKQRHGIILELLSSSRERSRLLQRLNRFMSDRTLQNPYTTS